MDMDSFTQCLSYMSANGSTKGALEVVTPFVTAIVSFTVGFLVNMWRDHWKEKKITNNKKACVDEDINRAKGGVEQTFKECIKILDLCQQSSPIRGHNLPSEIAMPGLDEYFWSIAHSYTETERHYIVFLTPAIRKLNKDLEQLVGSSGHGVSGDIAVKAYNLISYALHCHAICLTLQTGEIQTQANIVVLADKLELHSPYIERIREHEAASASET